MSTSTSATISVKLEVLDALLQNHGGPKSNTAESEAFEDSKAIVKELIACREIAKSLKLWALNFARTAKVNFKPFAESVFLSERVKEDINTFVMRVHNIVEEEFPFADVIEEYEARLEENIEVVNVHSGGLRRKEESPAMYRSGKVEVESEAVDDEGSVYEPGDEAYGDNTTDDDEDKWVPIWDGKVKETRQKGGL